MKNDVVFRHHLERQRRWRRGRIAVVRRVLYGLPIADAAKILDVTAERMRHVVADEVRKTGHGAGALKDWKADRAALCAMIGRCGR